MKRYTKGFTLIELLVVIAIIGILASVVLVSLNSARKKGNDARVISDVQQIRTQLESDYANGVYDLTCTAANFCSITTSSAGAPTGGTWGTNGNYVILATDAYSQNTDGVRITATTNVAAGGKAVGYAIYGRLASDTSKFFCIDSSGQTKPTSSGLPGTLTAANADDCNP